MALDDYHRKRNFSRTPEPSGKSKSTQTSPGGKEHLRFVIQKHQASRLHYDFRLEAEGVLKSWAVPKGPSMKSQDQRLAVQVEDHPLEYGTFEGIIPRGNYGAGTVMVWDDGIYVERNSKTRESSEKAILKGIEEGHITFLLKGKKLRGEFALVRIREEDSKSWLLIKKRDSFASHVDILSEDRSVKSGRSMEEITQDAPSRGDIWYPLKTRDADAHSHSPSPERRRAAPPPGVQHPLTSSSKPEKFPRRNRPMLATPFAEPFDQKGWLFELDYGGRRALAELEGGRVRLYSKSLLSFDKKYPEIVHSLLQAQRKCRISAVLDGEIVDDPEEEPGKPIATYWVRDLLHLDGINTRILPLIERKKLLEQLDLFNNIIRYCPHELQKGTAFFGKTSSDEFKGILARDWFSLYRSGTSKSWLKIPFKEDSSSQNKVRLSHLDRIYWPEEQITKRDLIEYYRKVAPLLLPHLLNRPQSLHRFPNGIESPSFFQKDLIGHHPRWVQTERIFSESVGKSIDYLLCQNEETLLYMANLGCIELNPWLSRIQSLDRPDVVVIDIDPDEHPFSQVVEVAWAVHEVLESISAFHLCKTSGSTGLHLYIPIQAEYDYETSREFALAVCKVVHRQFPNLTSLERTPAKRRGKIYLDCFQNAQGQTVASVYSVRPRPNAPVSTPLLWKELKPTLRPEAFHLKNLAPRIEKQGDLWQPLLETRVDLKACLSSLRKKYPMAR